MELKSISGVTCYVKNLDKTAKFYQELGFRLGKRESHSLTVYVNWFWIKFCDQSQADDPELQKEARLEPKGAGMYLSIKVDNADDCYKEVTSKGLKPDSEPKDESDGRREFVLRDPDGYKLVFFAKK